MTSAIWWIIAELHLLLHNDAPVPGAHQIKSAAHIRNQNS